MTPGRGILPSFDNSEVIGPAVKAGPLFFHQRFVLPRCGKQSRAHQHQSWHQWRHAMRQTLGLSIAAVILACCFCPADTLIFKDGSRHSGTFVSATSRVISFKEGTTVHRYNRSKIQSIEFDGAATTPVAKAVAPQSPARPPATVTLPAGTEIAVLTNEAIDSKTANEGQTFQADV